MNKYFTSFVVQRKMRHDLNYFDNHLGNFLNSTIFQNISLPNCKMKIFHHV